MTDTLLATGPIYSTLSGDPDLNDLVEMFIGELPDRMDTLRSQLAAGELAELGRTAHQLKGAAGSYGFACVTPVAQRLESVAKTQEPEDTVREALEALIAMCERLRAGSAD